MIDPVSLIVGALVRGLLSGLETTAEHAVTDTYLALKGVLINRYGKPVEASIDMLEQQPTSTERQAAVAWQLKAAGADRDTELARLAEQLTHLVENLPPPEPPADPVERVHRRAGMQAVGQVLDQHIGTVLRTRSEYLVDDTDLLTAGVGSAVAVPPDVRKELASLHERIRSIIEQIAARIEDAKYNDAEQTIAGLRIGYNERQRATRLVQADKQLHVSYQALRVAVEFFSGLNQNVLARIETEVSPERQANMMLGNAIMIYELTDFVIRYIQGFTVRGTDEIGSLHADAKRRIADLRTQQQALAEQANRPEVDPAARRQTLDDIQNRQSAIDELDREWEKYVSEVDGLDSSIDQVRSKIPTLELIRQNAKVQIGLIQEVALLHFLRQSSATIKGTVDALQGFQLAPLSSARVRRLLGI